MATPPFLRYLPARLKPLGNPAIWAPLTIFTLVSAFIWEYHNNPDLFNRQPIGSLTPNSTLTPEEEARLSEIDNLDVLLEGSRVPSNTETVTGQINPVDVLTENAEGTDASQTAADSENPFTKYEAEYQFAGSANPGSLNTTGAVNPASSSAANGSNSGSSSAASGSRFNFGSGLLNPTAPSNNSALSEALNRQNAVREAEAAAGQDNAPSNRPNQPINQQPATGSLDSQPVAPAAGTVAVPFIRTTPNMSPPAGGTGYQAPATSNLPVFNIAPQQTTTNPYNLPAATQQPNQSAVPTVPSVQPGAQPGTGGTAYTPPTFTQPDQGRAINPRR